MDPREPTALSGWRRGGKENAAGPRSCSCLSCSPASWRRSVKRKLNEKEAEARFLSCVSPDGNELGAGVARVEIQNEAAALRETLISHQQSIQKLQAELEEERSAASSAATEAMSMILRLQHEKAEAQMEARQFKRLADEKMSHDQQEIASLEDLVFKRDEAVQALSCEVQAYRHRLLSLGSGIDGDSPPSEPQTPDIATPSCVIPQFDLPQDYPPLRCTTDAGAELDKYPSGETPREHLQKIGQHIFQLERMPSSSFCNKGVIVGQSPGCLPRHLRTFSYGSYGSGLEFGKGEEFPDYASDYGGRDDMSDRVYTVDAVHGVSEDYVSTPRELHTRRGVVEDYVSTPRELQTRRGVVEDDVSTPRELQARKGLVEDYVSTPRELQTRKGLVEDYVSTPRELQTRRGVVDEVEEAEIRKLSTRLQALEADRESMRQALISVGTDKTQMALLKETAQQICKEVVPKRRVINKPPPAKKFSIMSMIKSVISFVFWRKKPSRVRYTFGLSLSNVGLLLLLDKSPRTRQRRFLTRTQG